MYGSVKFSVIILIRLEKVFLEKYLIMLKINCFGE